MGRNYNITIELRSKTFPLLGQVWLIGEAAHCCCFVCGYAVERPSNIRAVKYIIYLTNSQKSEKRINLQSQSINLQSQILPGA